MIVVVCFVQMNGEMDCKQTVKDEAACHELAKTTVPDWNEAVLKGAQSFDELVLHYFCAEGRKWMPTQGEQ